MTRYSDIRKETAQRMGDADDAGSVMLACWYCHEPTKRAVLSLYGRCQRCYDALCRMPMPQFDARFQRGKRPSSEQVRQMAEDMGIEVPEAPQRAAQGRPTQRDRVSAMLRATSERLKCGGGAAVPKAPPPADAVPPPELNERELADWQRAQHLRDAAFDNPHHGHAPEQA